MILRNITQWLEEVVGEAGNVSFVDNLKFGDVTTTIGIKNKNAHELVEKLRAHLPEYIEDISVAGPGFINFSLKEDYLLKEQHYEKSSEQETVLVEYTDPNPFKEFHIGHLMSNAIGEAIASLIEATGKEVKRVCYQGDVGMHVAKALWRGYYAQGAKAYEEDESARREIQEINKKIYSREDEELNTLYEKGKTHSLQLFEIMYKKLGTSFEAYFFESESGPRGLSVVKAHIPQVFQESEGAVIYKGEERDSSLHTRVFINKDNLPTYEAKELGLLQMKQEKWPDTTLSIVITGNEVNDYFKVIMSAAQEISLLKDIAKKTHHIGHGMLRLPTGKMSSRTGDVITAESLITSVKEEVLHVMEKNGRSHSDPVLAEKIAIGAIKFMILRQHAGKDIIFDVNSSVSFEGDSGPYLMYTHARACSLLAKAQEKGIVPSQPTQVFEAKNLLRLLARYDDVLHYAASHYAPNHMVEYLLRVSAECNSWYAREQVLTDDLSLSAQRLALIDKARDVIARGLTTLGIAAPESM